MADRSRLPNRKPNLSTLSISFFRSIILTVSISPGHYQLSKYRKPMVNLAPYGMESRKFLATVSSRKWRQYRMATVLPNWLPHWEQTRDLVLRISRSPFFLASMSLVSWFQSGGRNFERPNVEPPIFRNLKIADEGYNLKR